MCWWGIMAHLIVQRRVLDGATSLRCCPGCRSSAVCAWPGGKTGQPGQVVLVLFSHTQRLPSACSTCGTVSNLVCSLQCKATLQARQGSVLAAWKSDCYTFHKCSPTKGGVVTTRHTSAALWLIHHNQARRWSHGRRRCGCWDALLCLPRWLIARSSQACCSSTAAAAARGAAQCRLRCARRCHLSLLHFLPGRDGGWVALAQEQGDRDMRGMRIPPPHARLRSVLHS